MLELQVGGTKFRRDYYSAVWNVAVRNVKEPLHRLTLC